MARTFTVPAPPASAPPQNLGEMQILRHTPDLLKRNFLQGGCLPFLIIFDFCILLSVSLVTADLDLRGFIISGGCHYYVMLSLS